MSARAIVFGVLGSILVATGVVQAAGAHAATRPGEQVRRGHYLADFGGCNDCHTPKLMTPRGPVPDAARLLSGHPANAPLAPVPAGALTPTGWGALAAPDLTAWAGPWGVSFAANLTPDKDTGLGAWTAEAFIRTMRTGKHLGVGRELLPPMPWFNLNALTDGDLRALFAYLRSIEPIHNAVPAPILPR